MKRHVSRRSFFHGISGLLLLLTKEGAEAASVQPIQRQPPSPAFPAIDSHIHLFDPRRIGGIPWPEKTNSLLYRPSLPRRYRRLAEPLGIVGAVAIECSPLLADNDWLLQVAQQDNFIVGVIGDLDPAHHQFPHHLDRLQANPLFLGIRYGNLWGRDLGARLKEAAFVANLKQLARSQLLLESANPDRTLIADLLQLTALVPDLRIMLDHLPHALPPSNPGERNAYLADLRALSRRANVFVKISEVPGLVDGKVLLSLPLYRPWLDEIWEIFGEDHLVFGSDWPNSDQVASLPDTWGLVAQYMQARGAVASDKFYCKNSETAYRWKPRSPAQHLALTRSVT